jgi:invasin D
MSINATHSLAPRPFVPTEVKAQPPAFQEVAAATPVDISDSLSDEVHNRLLKQNGQSSDQLAAARFRAARLVAGLNEQGVPTPDAGVVANLDNLDADLKELRTRADAKTRLAQGLADQLASCRHAGQLTQNALMSAIDYLRARGHELPPEAREQIAKAFAQVLAEKLGSELADSGIENPIGVRSSFDDILDGLQDLIGIIKDDYLDVYARMVEAYAKMFAEFNTEVIGKLHQWLSVDDKGNVTINSNVIRGALDSLMSRYSLPNPDAVLFPVPGEDGSLNGSSMEDALKWLAAMGLPASCLKQLPDGSFCVVMDLQPLREMKDRLPGGDHPKLSPAQFQAWQAAWNAKVQEVESALQKHTQKYSNANSIHDNVQKVISSTLSALFEMLKAFSASLG